MSRAQLPGLTDLAGNDEERGYESVAAQYRECIPIAILVAVVERDDEGLGRRLDAQPQVVPELTHVDRLPAGRRERVHLGGEDLRRYDQARDVTGLTGRWLDPMVFEDRYV